MSIAGLCKRVSSFGFTLLERGYALDARPHGISAVKGRIKALSWARDDTVPLILPPLPRVDDYLRLIRNNEYSFLMRDGAAIQIQYQFDGATLTKHRLLYWPCPFEAQEVLNSFAEPVIDVIESQFLVDKT